MGDDFVIQSKTSCVTENISVESEMVRNYPNTFKRLKIGEGGGKTKMLNIQMKVVEPKWKQEQRRSLQNTANKYAKRSSRTFICCSSLKLKARFPN